MIGNGNSDHKLSRTAIKSIKDVVKKKLQPYTFLKKKLLKKCEKEYKQILSISGHPILTAVLETVVYVPWWHLRDENVLVTLDYC